ncbi:MAG TPA: hypothetical protein VMV10_22370 [Pirellulales bacterium]|nr:hypothetical protein [Pirellulales bacterium]
MKLAATTKVALALGKIQIANLESLAPPKAPALRLDYRGSRPIVKLRFGPQVECTGGFRVGWRMHPDAVIADLGVENRPDVWARDQNP